MASYRGALETAKSPEDAFDYMADFRNAAEWDPATVSISQTAGTGAELGARYRLVTRFVGRPVTLDYQTIGFKPVDELVLAFKGHAVEGTDTITIISRDAGTRLVYSVEFDLKWRWLTGLAVPFFTRAADKALAGLARALGGSVVDR